MNDDDAEWSSSSVLLMHGSGSHVCGPDCVSEMVEASSRDVEWQSNTVKYVHHKKSGVGTGGWRKAAKARRTEGRWVAIAGCTLETAKAAVCGEARRGDAGVPLTDQRLPVGSKDGDSETTKGGPLR